MNNCCWSRRFFQPYWIALLRFEVVSFFGHGLVFSSALPRVNPTEKTPQINPIIVIRSNMEIITFPLLLSSDCSQRLHESEERRAA